MNPLVELIASQTGMADRLLAQHVDDGSGRCRTCTVGGQAGYHVWPCTIHDSATRARDLVAAREAHSRNAG